jgi:transmembrane sensor
MSQGLKAPQQDIDADAADWVVRLDAPDIGAEERAAFSLWVADPRHRAAYEHACIVWQELAQIEPVATVPAIPRQKRMVSRRSWVQAAALSACLFLTLKAGTLWYGNPLTSLGADHRTGIGEISRIALPDGSFVTLNTGSAIALAFSGNERRIELIQGEIYVEAAPMGPTEPRPLIVETDAGTAKALGTRFSVDSQDDASNVTVLEHTVAVSTVQGQTIVLSPGQSVRMGHQGLGAIKPVNGDQTTSWQRGRLIFDRAPLADVLTELNRYRRGKILLSRDDLLNRQVSGVFDLNNLDGALVSITRELGLKTAQMPLLTLIY